MAHSTHSRMKPRMAAERLTALGAARPQRGLLFPGTNAGAAAELRCDNGSRGHGRECGVTPWELAEGKRVGGRDRAQLQRLPALTALLQQRLYKALRSARRGPHS